MERRSTDDPFVGLPLSAHANVKSIFLQPRVSYGVIDVKLCGTGNLDRINPVLRMRWPPAILSNGRADL